MLELLSGWEEVSGGERAPLEVEAVEAATAAEACAAASARLFILSLRCG